MHPAALWLALARHSLLSECDPASIAEMLGTRHRIASARAGQIFVALAGYDETAFRHSAELVWLPEGSSVK
jgi:hypothetical protein